VVVIDPALPLASLRALFGNCPGTLFIRWRPLSPPQTGARGHRLETRRCPYTPGNRGLWLKVKCLYREEFLVVAGPIRKGGGRGSARCCSPTTIRTAGWSMPAVPAPASSRRSWSCCGEGCNRFPSGTMPLDVPPPA